MAATVTPVILSGGAGQRLWPLSTPARPKQFQALAGEGSLLRQAAERMRGDGFAAPVVVCNAAHVALVREQLADAGVKPALIVAEPVGRNTCASALLAAVLAADSADVLLIAPSDHSVADPSAFRRAAAEASPAAEAGALVVFGVRPDRAETAYGYILPANGEGVRPVQTFCEKPNAEIAVEWLADGRRLWNAGLLLVRADRLIEEAERYRPDILQAVGAAVARSRRQDGVLHLDEVAFAAVPAESLDYAILEKTDRAVVVELDAGWSDLGSYDALWRAAEKDGDGNAGADVAVDSAGCWVSSDGPAVALVGVENLAVVVREGVVLVVAREADQRVRVAAEAMRASGREDLL